MMTGVIMLMFLILAAALQSLLPAVPWLGQAAVPLLPAVSLYFALHRGAGTALAAGFLAGFLQDALSPVPLGYSSGLFCAAVWAVGRLRNVVLADSPLTSAFFGAVSAGVVTAALYLLLARDGTVAQSPAGTVLLKSLGQGVAGLVATPPVFGLMRLVDGLVGNVREHEDIAEIDWSV